MSDCKSSADYRLLSVLKVDVIAFARVRFFVKFIVGNGSNKKLIFSAENMPLFFAACGDV